MELQKNNEVPKALEKLSKTNMCVSLAKGDFKAVSNLLPTKISQATKEPPMSDLIKIVGHGKIVLFVKSELIKMSERINVSGNLSVEQLEFIATQLIELFPNESLADFKLCFERGCIGQYGEIFRMDGIVLRKWMERYLDEKYTVIEEELKKEKSGEYSDAIPPAEEGPGYRAFKEWAKTLQQGSKVPGMTDADHRKYGQEKPIKESKTSGYKYFTVRNIQVYALTQEHAEELVQLMIKRGDLIED